MYKKIMSWIILIGIIVTVVGLIISFNAAPGSRFGKIAGEAGIWSIVVWSCCIGWMAYDPKKD